MKDGIFRIYSQLKEAGLIIAEQKEDIVKTRFYDIGAIVFYLKQYRGKYQALQ